jgi:propionyl-CoA carboxylase alpha chain
VIRVGVAVGDQVKQGQPLLWLEAMKMEHTISAPADGILTELAVAAGQQVEVGVVLAVVSTAGIDGPTNPDTPGNKGPMSDGEDGVRV